MRAKTLRMLIRGLGWDAEEAAATFANTAKAASRLKLTAASSGKILTSTSSGGTSVQFTVPQSNVMSPEDVLGGLSWILDQIDVAVAADADITDAELIVALLAAADTRTRATVMSFTGAPV